MHKTGNGRRNRMRKIKMVANHAIPNVEGQL